MEIRRIKDVVMEMPYEMKISLRRYVFGNYDTMRNSLQNSCSGSVTFENREGWQITLHSVEELEQLLKELI